MSRGLGKHQREIKRILQRAWDADLPALPFASIRGVFIMSAGGDPETDRMNPNFERSLKRSIRALVDRGDVVRMGDGGQQDPFRYATVEAFTGEPNTDDAKREFKEMVAAVPAMQAALAKLGEGSS